MSRSSRTTGQIISEEEFETLWEIFEHYRYERQTTGKQQEAIVTILNDFTEVIE